MLRFRQCLDTGYQWVDDYCQDSQWVCDYQTICEGSCDEWGCWEACWSEATNCREETYSYVCGGHEEAYQYNCREESFTYACGEHPEPYQYNCRDESYQYVCGSHEESQPVNCRDEQYACNAHCPAPPPPPTAGCTDPNALNYNPNATVDDGSCSYPPPSTDLTLELPGVSGPMQGGNSWYTVHGDSALECIAEIRTSRPVLVTVRVTISGTGITPISGYNIGPWRARAAARLPSIWNDSPNQFHCVAEFSAGTESSALSADVISARFWGAYDRDAFGNQDIVYEPDPSCNHDGMFFSNVTMKQPVPGYPLENPPLYMQDSGMKVSGSHLPTGPLFLHLFTPSDNHAICQAAQ